MREVADILRDLGPTLEQLEPTRQLYLRRRSRYLFLLFGPLTALIAIAFAIETKVLGFVIAAIWFVIGVILYQLRAAGQGKEYVRHFKATVVPALLGTIDPGLHYDPASGIPSSTFVGTELFETRPDRYRTEDLIHGSYGKTFLQLAEVDAEERRTRTDSDGNTETYYVTIFDGLLLIADFHKHFHGRTFVFPDKAEKSFGNIGRFFQKMGGRKHTNLIRLEDQEFEHAFAVYSTDEVEARYILSTSLMRRLLDMRSRFGAEVRIGFKESCLLLSVPHSHPFLEPKTSLPATDTGQVERMLHELRYFLDTIEELDLNTRIWSKT